MAVEHSSVSTDEATLVNTRTISGTARVSTSLKKAETSTNTTDGGAIIRDMAMVFKLGMEQCMKVSLKTVSSLVRANANGLMDACMKESGRTMFDMA